MQRLPIAACAGALGLIGAAGLAQDGGRQLSLEVAQPTQTVETPATSAQAPAPPQDTEAAARWARLQAEAEAARERRRLEQDRYEEGVRQADEARRRYEADTARHREELERARLAEEEYRRQRAAYEAETGNVGRASRGARPAPTQASAGEGAVAPAAETRQERRARERTERERERQARRANESCEDRNRRNRRRGQVIGGIVGGLAVALADRDDREEVALLAVPAGVLLGDAIAQLLDCREQEQAAAATEQVVEQAQTAGAERGVGTTVAWTSETRPGVTGSSTVTALEQEAGGGECMTVTDIVIIDGQETRAPKRMCRRPPSNRFVRV